MGDVAWVGLALVVAQSLLSVVFLAVATTTVAPAPGAPEVTSAALLREGARLATSGPGVVAGLLTQWVVMLGIPAWAARRKGSGSMAHEFGLTFRRADLIAGLALAAGLQVLLLALGHALTAAGVDTAAADNTATVTANAGVWLVVTALGAALVAPVVEEVLFRGLLLRALLRRLAGVDLRSGVPAETGQGKASSRRRLGVLASAVLSAAVFGAVHAPVAADGEPVATGAAVLLAFQTGLLGLVFAAVAVRTRRLGTVIVAHMAFNTISLVATVLL